ncbi:NOL1/NOP2/sun family putative RNA methylase [Acidaminobacter sp. JC074]|uniref:RsmF rRNA methyltransferase first C-terminal domain-containing protein n=1 Tax=Acidaminobacter sp. JC074 TaxID=2530199 RepID=UPI001F0E4176|nr:RsmB/NOP family class I SAM-dependent RNA methyltransferase [Acidaminobacter sp. JC074]MCH4890388.1 NOL1/NOP2/sun family putative RNA methylase [Acidaminobacter sp. JC074]
MKLPVKFIEQMKEQLKDGYEDFLATYDHKTHRGIRVNTLKISVEDFLKITPFDLKAIPWTDDGFYIEEERPAKHPHYFAGLYYIQEPSAMLPAVLLEPDENDTALDLCAAPGGKTMQMAAMMKDSGVLIANDINNHRLKALIRNAELMGLRNLVVLNDKQENIRRVLNHKVDKLLIDAPCSGEGMFKKHDDAISAYEDYDVEACVSMQKSILDDVLEVLNGQGQVVYSTCTFNTYENEDMIRYAMNKKSLSLVDMKKEHGFEPGIDMKEVIRLYPHLLDGEGHFAAKLTYEDDYEEIRLDESANQPPELLQAFMDENLTEPLEGMFRVVKDKVFLMPSKRLDLSGLKVVKNGWFLGVLKKNRFEPSHAMALSLKKDQVKRTINFSGDAIEVIKYLKCETISCDGEKGYNLVCVDGHPIGWGKYASGKLKNLYPSQWRLS